MAEVFARLFHLTGQSEWDTRVTVVLKAFGGQPEQPTGMPLLLAAADLLEEGASVVIVGEPATAAMLARAALSAPDPAIVVLRAADTSVLPSDRPAYSKTAGMDGATAYVCRRNVCGLPITDPAELTRTLGSRE